MKLPALELRRRVANAQIRMLEAMLIDLDGVSASYRETIARQIAELMAELDELEGAGG